MAALILEGAPTKEEIALADQAARVAANHLATHNARLDKSLRGVQVDNYAKPNQKLRSVARKGARAQASVEAANRNLLDAKRNISALVGELRDVDRLIAGLGASGDDAADDAAAES